MEEKLFVCFALRFTLAIFAKKCAHGEKPDTAIEQIKRKKHQTKVAQHIGELLLAGINYDKKTNTHSCLIERWEEKLKICTFFVYKKCFTISATLKEKNKKSLNMKLNNNLEIPQIGVGTWTLRGETARRNVRLALEAGFRHIDTAQAYENEAEVGQGVADSGLPRDEVFITTKVATNIMREGREAVRQSINKSLSQLNTEYIDLLLIHWPVKDCVKDTWQVMEDCVRKGLARSIGVSNFNRHHLDSLLEYAEIRPVINQMEVHPFLTQEENIAYNHRQGIQVEAWGPFGQGDIDVVGHPLLQSLAQKYQKTASQIVLRWIVQRDLITIPRAKPHHFAENLDIMSFSLEDKDMQDISSLNKNLRSNVLNDPETFPW